MKVYDTLTGGRISNPMTDPELVLTMADQQFLESLDDWEEYRLFQSRKEEFLKWYSRTES
jgi:hypothetical protein